MKKLLPILLLIPFFSCSPEEKQKVVETSIYGEWVLVKTYGPSADSEKTGSEMAFQESYTLNEDSSFSKIRMDDGEEFQSTGSFEIVSEKTEASTKESEVFQILKLEHNSQTDITATCEADKSIEYLYFSSHRLENQHDACDGLRLMYQKEE